MRYCRYTVTCLLILTITYLVSACVDAQAPKDDSTIMINTVGRFERSTSASNLITSAIKKVLDVELVFFPSEALNEDAYAIVEKGMDLDLVKRRLMGLFAEGKWERIVAGSLRGSEIRRFLVNRTMETGRHDIHVDGLKYSVRLQGGLPAVYQVEMIDGSPLDDQRYYRVALSLHALQGQFPGYRFRHNFNFAFQYEIEDSHYIDEILSSYLQQIKTFGQYHDLRSIVEFSELGSIPGITPIYEIQGISHISPLLAYRVTTEGVVTAAGSNPQGGFEFFLQSEEGDGDDRSSDAILVRIADPHSDIVVGNKLQVSGVVHEELTNTGMTRTLLAQVSQIELVATDQALPLPVILGHDEEVIEGNQRVIPKTHISTHRGNLNQKESLNLKDGIDFWESLEGMRVIVRKPRVVGLSGGQKDAMKVRRYLNLFVVAKDSETPENVTPKGGLVLDAENNNYNPEIIKIVDHHFSNSVNPEFTFEVGDKFDYDLEGIMAYELNTFGEGEYVFYVTGRFSKGSDIKDLKDRTITTLSPEPGKLTVASYNIENVSTRDFERIGEIGKSIVTNLKCPDILNLVEVQDNNGVDFSKGPSAEETIQAIIKNIKGCEIPVDYQYVNIDPIDHNEGGQPGGNIRVAMIYNALRVSFTARGTSGPLTETYVLADGSINVNPGRVFPNDPAFERSRKSLIAEFSFAGERVFVIGNHLNSKLGDTSLWAANQPPVFGSERRRTQMASRLNYFVKLLLNKDPNANIVVVGDFNDFDVSQALRAMEGNEMKNLMHVLDSEGKPLVPRKARYTYNYQGNSQPIDFILATYPLLKREPEMQVVHINADYMGQIADHDPVIARFNFNIKP